MYYDVFISSYGWDYNNNFLYANRMASWEEVVEAVQKSHFSDNILDQPLPIAVSRESRGGTSFLTIAARPNINEEEKYKTKWGMINGGTHPKFLE